MNINVDIIIYICSSIVTIAGAFGLCLKWLKKYTQNITSDLVNQLMSKHDEHVSCDIRGVRNQLTNHIEQHQLMESRINDAIKALLRDRINSAYIEYKDKESIDLHALYVLEEIHKAYKQFNGNSFADGQMEAIRRLPTIVNIDHEVT